MFWRALEDMAARRFPIEVADRKAFMPAAGLPWFVAPFGRDSLIVSLQNILIYPHFARGALEFLALFRRQRMILTEMLNQVRFSTSCDAVNSRISNWCRTRRTTAPPMLHRYILSPCTQPGARQATRRYLSGTLTPPRIA